MTGELVLLAHDRQTEQVVAQALERAGLALRLGTCRSLAELAGRLETSSASIALVDVDPAPMAALIELEPLVRRFSTTRFVLLCSELAHEVLVEAMQIGARHCLAKRALPAELHSVLRRWSQDGCGTPPRGAVVSLLSTRGGCGVTTLAINLAEELRLEQSEPVLLVDLDLDYGACSTFLGVEPTYGVADVLAGGAGIDSELLRSTASKFRDDFQVLASPASIDPAQAHRLDLTHLQRFLHACRQTYRVTVVDAPRLPPESTLRLARASAAVLVVFELAVVDLRAARARIQSLEAQGIDSRKIFPLANRYKKRGPMLRLQDAEQALEGRKILTVSNDFESVIRSVNLGETMAELAPRSPARKDIRELLPVLASHLSKAI